MITFTEFALIIGVIVAAVSSFAQTLDTVYLFPSFSWLDLLVSYAFLEITYEFFLALVYGDYRWGA